MTDPCKGCPPFVAPCACGISDKFNRTGTDLGRADCGLAWTSLGGTHGTMTTDGIAGVAVLTSTDTGYPGSAFGGSLVSPLVPWLNQIHSMKVRLADLGRGIGTDILHLRPFGWPTRTFGAGAPHVTINPRAGESTLLAGNWDSEIGWASYSSTYGVHTGTVIPATFWVAGQTYTVSVFSASAGLLRLEVSDGSSSYSSDIGFDPADPWLIDWPTFTLQRVTASPGVGFVTWTVYVDDVDAPEFTKCSMFGMYDNFADRIVVGSWGAVSSGQGSWSTLSLDAGGTLNVADGGGGGPTVGWEVGRFDATAGGKIAQVNTPATGPWQTATGYVQRFIFAVTAGGAIDGGTDAAIIEVFDQDYEVDFYIRLDNGGVNGKTVIWTANGDNEDQSPKSDWEEGTFYVVEVTVVPAGDTTLRLWTLGEARPSAALLTVPTSGIPVTELTFFLSSGTAAMRIQIGDLDFDYEGKTCPDDGTLPTGPLANQQIHDELVATGDGTTTIFNTAHAYVGGTLAVQVAGMLTEIDNTYPASGAFTVDPAPPLGAPVRASYRASGA